MPDKTLRDVLSRAAHDPEFANQVINDPGQFKDEFNLSDDQLAAISAAGKSSLAASAVPMDQYESGS